MRRRLIQLLAAFIIAAPASVASALAGSPYEGGAQREQRPDVAPPPARRAPAGLFNCSYKEQRTKLERKNCGGLRS